MPATRNERDIIIKCATELEHLKENIGRLEKDFKEFKKEKKETERFTSTKKLTICMIVATILGGTIGGIIVWVLTKSYP